MVAIANLKIKYNRKIQQWSANYINDFAARPNPPTSNHLVVWVPPFYTSYLVAAYWIESLADNIP